MIKIDKIGKFCVVIMAIIACVLLLTLSINKHARITILETWSHYVCKVKRPKMVICGDSIAAGGGHWSQNVGLLPLQTRNLAGTGYTIRQITEQVNRAVNDYRPKMLIVFGGTNDAFAIKAGAENMEQLKFDFETLLASAHPTPIMFILPPPPV